MAKSYKKPGGGKPDKQIRDALLAAARQDPTRLKRAAETAWEKACGGDLGYFKEIADRLDGKTLVQAEVDVTSGGDKVDAGISRLADLIAQIAHVKGPQ